MDILILSTPQCPNERILTHRLYEALADHTDARITHRVVLNDEEALELGMHGSPTLLINGVDPFASADDIPSFSCRLYGINNERTDGAPSIEQLRQALWNVTKVEKPSPNPSEENQINQEKGPTANQVNVDTNLAETFQIATRAIKSGDISTLSALLQENPRLSVYKSQYRTLLNQTADWPGHWPKRLESAALLLNAGADINSRSGNGETTLQWAVSCNDTALTELLIKAGAPVNGINDDCRPLAQALFYESKEAAELLVKLGAFISLEFAAGLGRVDLLSAFFDVNGDLFPEANHHYPPINHLVPQDDINKVEIIDQAMVYAAINGHIDAAKYLIDHGADVTAKASGFTHKISFVDWARHHPDMMEFLIHYEGGMAEIDLKGNGSK